jgi:hypothetical protein
MIFKPIKLHRAKRRNTVKTKLIVSIVVLTVLLVSATAAFAAVIFDPETGTGFVGKGDVQLVYAWNNKQLQDNAASVQFRANSEVVSEVSWVCTKDEDHIQERARTSTSSIAGVLASIAREKNQITGFNLTGYDGDPLIEEGEWDGPKLNSCPNGWTLTTPAGDPEVVSSTGGMQVSINGTTWTGLTIFE